MGDDISTRLANNIKRLRDARGLSQQGLADASGVPRPTVAHLESGQGNPTLAVASKLARCLGVTLDRLVEEEGGELRVLELSELRVDRRGKAKRTSLFPESLGREQLAERIELKPGGSCQLETLGGAVAVVVCERGELVLTEGSRRAVLKPERVALVRGSIRCSSAGGAVAYRIDGTLGARGTLIRSG